jgi:hypothetical protein
MAWHMQGLSRNDIPFKQVARVSGGFLTTSHHLFFENENGIRFPESQIAKNIFAF